MGFGSENNQLLEAMMSQVLALSAKCLVIQWALILAIFEISKNNKIDADGRSQSPKMTSPVM